jgi:hypothetical protein
MTDEHLQDSLKLALMPYSPDFQQMVVEMQAETSQYGTIKSVLSMYVAFTTNLSCVVLFLPIFLLKSEERQKELGVNHWQF